MKPYSGVNYISSVKSIIVRIFTKNNAIICSFKKFSKVVLLIHIVSF